MVIALFAALIGPWFVNWNDYRASFEAEASRILGHRVHVEGNAHAIILPSPSLTFTNVQVDDESGQRIMDVARFDVVIELMPLLQGEIRVISMTLEKPVVTVAVDAAGKVPWLSRLKLHEPFDPNKVVLDNISIQDGVLNYSNAQSGVQLSYGGISAEVTARALYGPWHVDGSYLDNGVRASFRISTGRVLDDGTIRVKADVIPANLPMTIGVDGSVGLDPTTGLTWQGTYSLAQVAEAPNGDTGNGGDAGSNDTAGGQNGWRSEGTFKLTGSQLDISKAVLSDGPVDRPLSLAGTLQLNFGKSRSFAATAEARQIDLDRTLGKGPSQPVDVSAAADSLVAWLSQLPVPDMPGSIRLTVPTIVVGGRIIEGVDFTVAPAKGGWQIGALSARLPGQATLEASGLITTQKKFGFVGEAHLAVLQPSTFATWWRGSGQEGAGRLLAPFDLSGHAEIGPGQLALDHVSAKIDDATITGSFGWTESPKDRHRDLYADLDATRVDFVQLKALGELLVGRNLTNAGSLADGYSVHVRADAFAFEDLTVKGIEVNAKYRDDALTVTLLQIDDIGGARIARTSGKIDNLSGDPRGHLDATLDAPKLTGLARLADRFLPETGFTRWLDAAAPALGEAVVTAKIVAPLPDGGSGFAFTIDNGVAASTSFNVSAKFTGGFAHWRTKPAEIKATLDSPDSVGLARQLGLAAVALDKDNGAHVEVLKCAGIPAEGLDTVVAVDLAGLIVDADGKLSIGADLAPSFAGTLGVTADNIDQVVAMAGLDIPGSATGTPLALDKAGLSVSGQGLDLKWQNGKIGPVIVGGDVTLSPDGQRGWHIGGNLVADEVDLGWLASLGLGFAPLPTDDPAQPWSRAPFAEPAYGPVSGKLQVKADRLDVGDLGVTGTALMVALQPQRIDADLTAGQLDGGTVTGGMSIHNIGGNANVSAHFDLKGASLESFVWRRDDRSVATGTLDLSATFESTGRSPAGIVSTMTGGGVLGVHDGLARYVNPNTVRQIVRASDLGQQFSEDALRSAFSERIDADNLAFKDASGAFAIVAGAVRLKNLIVNGPGLSAKGNAVIDFNAMTLDSDWNLAFDPVDNKVQGADPEAGIVFHGPIAAPGRSIDVLPFAAYLNEREAARMNEIIALDAATRAEKERLSRLADKLKADADQRAEDLRVAAEREAARHAAAAAQSAILEAFHINREVFAEQRHVEALTGLADRLAAQQKQAAAAAAGADKAAGQARADADRADKALTDARQADKAAADKAVVAAADLAKAKADVDAASGQAAQLGDVADQAKQAFAEASKAEVDAKAAADKAVGAKADADKALKAAMAQASAAQAAATKADGVAASAASARSDADKAAAAARDARDSAQAVLADAEDAVKAAQAAADAAVSQATTLGGGESEAEAAKVKADADAKTAAEALTAAVGVRDAAAATLDAAKATAAVAQRVADEKAAQAKQAGDLAKALAAGESADAQAIATAQAMQTAADGAAQQAVAKKAVADAANAVVANQQANYDQAAADVAAAEKQAKEATATATAADAVVQNAIANASRAASDKVSAMSGLDEKIAARDAAKAALADKQAAVEKTATAAAAAAQADAEAKAAADLARTDAGTALAAKDAAAKQAADLAAAANDAAKTADAATSKRVAAAADAKTAVAKAQSAASASAAAARTLAAKAAANDSAQGLATAAAADRQTAEAEVARAAAEAERTAAAAKSAAAEAAEATQAADAAQKAADLAAQNLASSGPIEVRVPPAPDTRAAGSAAATVAAEPASTPPVPAPRKTSPPLPLVPRVLPTDGPLIITPPKY